MKSSQNLPFLTSHQLPCLLAGALALVFAFYGAETRAGWTKFDDFTGYTTGSALNGQGSWVNVTTGVTCQNDPAGSSGPVGDANAAWAAVYKTLANGSGGNVTIPANSTATCYFRYRQPGNTSQGQVGLCRLANPSSGLNFTDTGFDAAMVAIYSGSPNIGAYNGATQTGIFNATANTWYSFWLVVNTTAGTYDVYCQGGSQYPSQTKIATGYTFRGSSGSTALNSFAIASEGGSDGTADNFVDDIWVDLSGQDLAVPSACTAPSNAPTSPSGSASGKTVTLNWTDAAAGGGTINSYYIYRSTSSGGEGTTPVATLGVVTTYGDTPGYGTFYYKIAAVSSGCAGPQSTEVGPISVATPSAPGSPAASVGNTAVVLNWTAPNGSPTSYNIYRGTSSGGEGGTPVATGVTGTKYTDFGLTGGTTYYYTISASNGSGEGPLSTEVNATPFTQKLWFKFSEGSPYAQTTDSINSVSLSISNNSGVSYSAPRVAGPNSIGSALDFSGSGATMGGNGYLASATSQSGFGFGNVTNLTTTLWLYPSTAPTATQTGVCVAGGVSTITDLKQANSVGQTVAGSYVNTTRATVLTKTLSATTWQFLAETYDGANINSYTGYVAGVVQKGVAQTALASATVAFGGSGSVFIGNRKNYAMAFKGYIADVRFYNGAGDGNFITNTWLLAQSQVTGVSGSASGVNVTVSWTTWAPSGLYGTAGYNVYRATASAGPYSKINGSTPVTTTSYADNGLSSGTYYYEVTPVNSAGEGVFSAASSGVAVSACTPPGVPSNPQVTAACSGSVTVSWTASTGSPTGYNVKRSTTSGSGYTTLAAGANVAGSPFTDNTAANGTTYYYVISALNVACESANSSQVGATPLASPTGQSASAGCTSITVSWTASTGATGYNVKRTTTSGSGYTTLPAGVNVSGSPFVDSTASAATPYYYVISALNGVGCESADSSQTTGTALLTTPSAPTITTATAGCGSVALTWTTVSGATGYNVQRSSTSGSGYATVTGGGNVSGTNFTDTTGTGGAQYYYEVSALNACGTGANSAPQSATPVATPVVPVSPAATAGCGAVTLSWTASSGATTYSIYRGTSSNGETTATYTGVIGASYNDTAVTAGTMYYYRITALNGSCESAKSTEVSAAPGGITTQPTPQSVCSNSPASFTVAASGATGYQWRKNGNNITGATSASYSIPAAMPCDAGSYDCVVTVPCGVVNSTAVALAVSVCSSGPAGNWTLIDNFESYSTGNLGSQGHWHTVGTAANVQVIADPLSGANKCLVVNAAWSGAYNTMASSIPANSTATIFFRGNFPGQYAGQSFAGLSKNNPPSSMASGDTDLTAGLEYNGYNTKYVGAYNNTTFNQLFNSNAMWFKYWIVVNTTANTYAVYTNTAGPAVATGYAFQGGGAGSALPNFLFGGLGSNGSANNYVDDIYIDYTGDSHASDPTIAAPPGPSACLSETDVSCNGDSDGTVTASFSGGTSPYSIKIDAGSYAIQTSPYTFTGLSAGSHTVTVKDANNSANAFSITVNQPAVVTPSVSIAASPGTTTCSNTPVTFTATPVNGGSSPMYQWTKNSITVQSGASNTYVDSGLVNGDTMQCVMTSSDSCATPPTANSNTLTMTITGSLTPAVNITPSQGTSICPGTSVTFTAQPIYGGITPSYQWKKNGGNVGSYSSQYTDAGLNDGDTIQCALTSSDSCASPSTANSNTITMNVASVGNAGAITGSTTVTAGTNGVSYSIAPVSGASSYAWYAPSGASVATGQGSTSITVNYGCAASSGSVMVIPVGNCNGGSSSLSVTVTPANVGAAGTITQTNPSGTSVCASQSGVVYTIAAVSGATSYTWTVPTAATVFSGQGSASITVNWGGTVGNVTVTPANALGCTGTSGSLTVTAVSAPGITSSPTPQTVCQGATVSFSVVATNATSYQWQKNGSNLSDGGTIIGSATATLTLTNVGTGDSGASFDCVASGACSPAATSSAATLTVGNCIATGIVGLNIRNVNAGDTAVGSASLTADGFSHWTDSASPYNGAGTVSLTPVAGGFGSVTATYRANGQNTVGCDNSSNGDQRLYRGYLDDGGASSVQLSGLSAWLTTNNASSYQIRLYLSADSSSLFNAATVTNVAGTTVATINVTIMGNACWPLTTCGDGNISCSATVDIRGYADSVNLTNDSITISMPVRTGTGPTDYRSCIAAVKLTPFAKTSTTTSVSSSSNPTCVGQPVTFTATVSPSTATGTVQFQTNGVNFGAAVALSGGSASTAAISSLPAGSTTVTAFYSGDANNNASDNTASPFTQTINALPTASAGSPVAMCAHSAGVTIGGSPTANGGSGSGYTYSWLPATGLSSPTVANPTASPSSTTTYTVTVTDTNGCTSDGSSVTVTVYPQPSLSLGQTSVSCNGGGDGSVTATFSGGTAPYAVKIDGGSYATQTSPYTFTGLAPGSHTVTVQDVNGCNSNLTLTVTQPTAVTFTTSQVNESCNGQSIGSITVTASGGSGSYTYSKDNGSTFQAGNVFSGLAAGTCNIVVKDSSGCLSSATAVTITQPSAISLSLGESGVSCNGGNNGTVTATFSGGTGTLQVKIDGGSYSAQSSPYMFTGLTAGSHTVSLQDANGCTASQSTTVTQPTAVTFTTSQVNESCNGQSIGSITVTALGGNESYTYSDDNGATFQAGNIFSGLAAGAYNIVLKDSNGCLSSGSAVTITQPTVLGCSVSPSIVTNCAGSSQVFTVSVSGGTAGYTYSWSGPNSFSATGSSVTNDNLQPASAGTYIVTVTDADGCQSTCIADLTVNVSPLMTSQPTNTAVCVGSSTTLSVMASGSPLNYVWRKLGSGWGAGGWSFTNSGAASSEFIGSSTDNDSGDTASHGGNDINTSGQAWALFNNGGVASAQRPFNSPLAVGQTFSIDIDNGNIQSGGTVGFGLQNTANNDNRLEVFFVGGSDNYAVSDSAGSSDSGIGFTRTGIHCEITLTSADTYSITIVRFAGSVAAESNTLTGTLKGTAGTVIDRLRLFNANAGDCGFGCNDYTLYFNNISFGCTDDNAGNYASGSWTNGSDLGQGPLADGGDVSGAATTTLTINPASSNDAGSYDVFVTNSCGVAISSNATLTVNSLPTQYVVGGGGAYCSGGSGVSVALSNSDIGVNYQLELNTSPTSAPLAGTGSALSFSNQTATGTYTVVAVDALTGCTSTMSGSATVTVNPNPTAFNVIGGGAYCFGGAGVAVGLDGSQTNVTYQLQVNNDPTGSPVTGTGSAIAFGNQTAGGTYTVVAMAATTGCAATMNGSATVMINPPPSCSVSPANAVICAGGSQTFTVNPSGGTPGYTYLWSDGSTGTSIVTNAAGTYSVTVTDSNGCTTTCSAMLTVNPNPTVFNMTGGGAYCADGSGVAVGLNGSQSGVNYQLELNSGPIGSPVTGTDSALSFGSQTAVGSYTVVAVNGTTGCTSTMDGSATVTVNPLPSTPTAGNNGPICAGSTLNISTPTVAGATYSWTGPSSFASSQQNPSITNATTAASGTYLVTIMDSNGCTSAAGSTAATVNPNPPTPTAGNNGPILEGNTLNLTASTVNNTTYSWSGPNGFESTSQNPSITNATTAASGTYIVTVTDSNGCTSTAGSTTALVAVLQITSIRMQGTDILITWSTTGGTTNALQATLGNPGYNTDFVDIGGPLLILGSGDTSTNYVDYGAATNSPVKFYRVRLVP